MADLITHHTAELNDFTMHYVTAGKGPPIVLIHGWPQSWYEWRRVIPGLAEHYTVIAPDLRGLGDSGRPVSGYDKRTLAGDVRTLLGKLRYKNIGVVGHDWGGSVAYFLAYDYPDLVRRMMILDMIPALGELGGALDLKVAQKIWHVFFHGAAADLAEKLVAKNLRDYLSHFCTSTHYNYSPAVFNTADIDEYVRVYSAPGALRAGFQYYRAGLNEDLENMASCTRKLQIPLRVWGGEIFLGNIVPMWEKVAENVSGGCLPQCGHFVAEEQPAFALEQMLDFFADL